MAAIGGRSAATAPPPSSPRRAGYGPSRSLSARILRRPAPAPLHRPRVVLCPRSSSPTSASPPSTSPCRRGLSSCIRELQAELGIAYLFISHDMAVVENISHRVAVMYLGQIVETGNRAHPGDPRHAYTRRLLDAVLLPIRHDARRWSRSPKARCRPRSTRSATAPSGSGSGTSAAAIWSPSRGWGLGVGFWVLSVARVGGVVRWRMSRGIAGMLSLAPDTVPKT